MSAHISLTDRVKERLEGKQLWKGWGWAFKAIHFCSKDQERENQSSQKETGFIIFYPPIPCIAVHKEIRKRTEA